MTHAATVSSGSPTGLSPLLPPGQLLEFRLRGNLLALCRVAAPSSPGRGPLVGPLPSPLLSLLDAEIGYHYKTQDRTVDPPKTVVEHVPLFQVEPDGSVITSIGWRYRLGRHCRRLGLAHRWVSLDPPWRAGEECGQPWPRKDRYRADFDRFFQAGYDLRSGQDQILALMEALEHAQFAAPTGSGKSFLIGAYALTHPDARIHVVTPSVQLQEGLRGAIQEVLGQPVGIVNGNTVEWHRVSVVSAHSLHKVECDDPHDPRFADTLIGDEVHELAAPKFQGGLARYQHCRAYGFSASLGVRYDGADPFLEGVFGEVRYQASYQASVEQGCVVPIEVEWLRYCCSSNLSALRNPVTRKKRGIWQNADRNAAIADRVLRCDPGQQVLIMVDTVEHLLFLKELLPDAALAYNPQSMTPARYREAVTQGILHPERDPPLTRPLLSRLRQRYGAGEVPLAIATGVWYRGVDFPQLALLVRAEGKQSRTADIQAPGRLSRLFAGKRQGRLIDLWDESDNGFLRSSVFRHKSYALAGWRQPSQNALRASFNLVAGRVQSVRAPEPPASEGGEP